MVCRYCGATFREELVSCPQCHAPLAEARPDPHRDRPPEHPSEDEAPDEENPRAPEKGLGIEGRPLARSTGGRLIRREAEVIPVFSRWRGGPNSFGPVAKVTTTVVVLAMFPLGGFTGMQILYFVGYAPVAALVLWGLWRKERVS
jgi:hypothetical protein